MPARPIGRLGRVLVRRTEEHEQPRAARADDLAVHAHGGPGDPLDDGAHGTILYARRVGVVELRDRDVIARLLPAAPRRPRVRARRPRRLLLAAHAMARLGGRRRAGATGAPLRRARSAGAARARGAACRPDGELLEAIDADLPTSVYAHLTPGLVDRSRHGSSPRRRRSPTGSSGWSIRPARWARRRRGSTRPGGPRRGARLLRAGVSRHVVRAEDARDPAVRRDPRGEAGSSASRASTSGRPCGGSPRSGTSRRCPRRADAGSRPPPAPISAARLLDDGIDVIALNVRADNTSAIHAYEQLGFAHAADYVEVPLSRHATPGTAAPYLGHEAPPRLRRHGGDRAATAHGRMPARAPCPSRGASAPLRPTTRSSVGPSSDVTSATAVHLAAPCPRPVRGV